MIRIENLKKAFGPKVILNNVTYHFPQGERIALVGANGAGKTTLLNIICQTDEADGGEIIRPRSTVLGYLPQEPNPNPAATVLAECLEGAQTLRALHRQMDAAMARMAEQYSADAQAAFERAEEAYRAAGGMALESKARGILLGLGFTREMQESHPKSLSGGWRMRLELARIFVNNPDFLVLDEPTNHLDLPSLVWVEKYLQSFPGTLLFVSHDRSLLNRLASITLHLHKGQLVAYKGNFDAFLEAREARIEQEEATAEQLRKRREHLESFIARFGAKATKARQAQSRAKMLTRIKDLEEGLSVDDSQDAIALQLPEPPPCGKEVYAIAGGEIGYPNRALARALDLKVHRGQKIAIIGANGIGKSTLLKTIAGRLAARAGSFQAGYNVEIAYFAQDQLEVLKEDSPILSNVLAASADVTERQARSLLGSFLFRGDDVFKPVGVLSGGEKSRVGLACLLVKRANFLLLDEPTNHLDMSSAEILAEAISEYEGTVLFVSHDRTFIDATCTHVFAMLPDGRSQLFAGQLADYERLAAVAGFPNVLSLEQASELVAAAAEKSGATGGADKGAASGANDKQQREQDRAQAQADKRERQKLERQQTKLDEDMNSVVHAIAALERDMATYATDFAKLRALQEQHDAQRNRLAELENEWLAVAERLNELGGA